jgi:hypothetical protein
MRTPLRCGGFYQARFAAAARRGRRPPRSGITGPAAAAWLRPGAWNAVCATGISLRHVPIRNVATRSHTRVIVNASPKD